MVIKVSQIKLLGLIYQYIALLLECWFFGHYVVAIEAVVKNIKTTAIIKFMYAFLGKDLHFGLPDGGFDPVHDQFEVGIAMSLRDRPFKLWFLKFDRLGLGYTVSSDGNFEAITFSMRSWFSR